MKQPADPSESQRYTVSELAEAAGLSTASIKFYLREKLLAPGDLAAEKKAYYDARHLKRLRLVRALRDIARLPVSQVRQLIRATEQGRRTSFELVAEAVDALAGSKVRNPTGEQRAFAKRVHQKLAARGLHVRDDSATLNALTEALHALRNFDDTLDVDVLDAYLDSVLPLARAEVAANAERILAGPESALIGAIVGTVLFEPMILLLRRLAHEHFARELYTAAASRGAKE